ncbi:MAG: twin-arginine translocation signal domain-containing protein [Chloroflexi bacterium]|nr:twin-arginine translocation signal domain-containing protein [Chloroflexota bacterium]
MKRRDFLKATAMTAVGALAVSCAQPTPQIIEKEVPVEKVVKETVVVQKEVSVEKVVTATPVQMKYKEAPTLAGLVQQGKLPPVDERLPEDPLVIPVVEEIGQYGGTWHRLATTASDVGMYNNRLTYENLVRWAPDGSEMLPNIAASWEISPDGKVFTFKLRKGMKWSDGEPFTAEDLAWLVEVVWKNKEQTPNFPAAWSPGGTPLVVETPDDYTARFIFGAPYGLMMVKMASFDGVSFNTCPAHYLKQFHISEVDKAKLETAAKAAGFEFWYQLYGNKNNALANKDKPVIFAWVPDILAPKQPIVLSRNPFYWKVDPEGNQLPYIDRIEFMVVGNAPTINLRAASGEVDMQLRHITLDNYPIFQENKEKGDYRVFLWDQGYSSGSIVGINLTNKEPVSHEIVNDKRFRYALSLSINRQEIIDGVYLGITEPTQNAPLKSSPHYWEEFGKNMIEYDLTKANAYLDEMGLNKRDADGYRLRPDGKRLSFIYEYTPAFGPFGDVAELLAAQWGKVGIEIIIKEVARDLYNQHLTANDIELTMWTGSAEFNPLIDPRWFVPSNDCAMSPWSCQYGLWWITAGKEGIEPTGDIRKVLEIYDEIKVTTDPDMQVKLFRQILELNKENLWVVSVCTEGPQPVIVKNNFRNVPEVALSDWQLQTIGNTRPEQYFIKQS